ncbi:phosphopantetheine-binding protein [Senegalia massiliensis]|uniref:Acyl carrier protein n=1 Tax=Senegalia massiliensis TaxID=1720316 RepID=A0A845QXD5_9CLOT|nr:acyl carrier protein [Senegalia massiliensis]
MNKDSIKRKLKKVLINILNLEMSEDEIADKELLFEGKLGFDSLATIRVVFAIEDEFDIEIEDEELSVDLFESIETLGEYIYNKLFINC